MELLRILARPTFGTVETIGDMTLMAVESFVWLFRRPFRWRQILQALEYVGVGSLFIVALTGLFTGMVLAYQAAYAFRMINAESMVGVSVAYALTREMSPVLTGLMVTARVGSAIATEIGTMNVTEQIDALRTMAVNPVQFLVTPRVVASIIMVPVLCQLCTVVGMLGAWMVAVLAMGLDPGVFFYQIETSLVPWDVLSGLIKAAVFGLHIAIISCYKGYHATGGARGVGLATTQAVAFSSIGILVVDYFLTVVMW